MATAKKAKKPTAAPTTPEVATSRVDPAPLVDELGAIEAKLAPFAGDIKRAEQLRSTIRGITDDKTSQVNGAQFTAVLGPRAQKTIVRYYDLAKAIGLDKYAQIATATIEALGKSVPAGILAHYLATEPTGTRPLQVVAKGGKA